MGMLLFATYPCFDIQHPDIFNNKYAYSKHKGLIKELLKFNDITRKDLCGNCRYLCFHLIS